MKQAFEYHINTIKSALKHNHNIENIDLSKGENIADTINNLLHILNIQDKVKVTDSKKSYAHAQFSIETKGDIPITDFQEIIKKIQNNLNSTSNNQSGNLETEEIIREIESMINDIPNNYKVFIGQTYKDESIAKADADLPNYWYFIKPSGTFYSTPIYRYFTRKGVETIESGGDRIYVFAQPKKIQKQSEHKENDMQKNSGCTPTLLFLIASIILLLT